MLKTIDPFQHIRSNEKLYFSGGQACASELATRLAGDALTLGASRTIALHRGPIWAVAADIDWLANATVPFHALFSRVVPFPQAGVNSMRSEVLLAAFADYIETWAGSDHHLLKGQSHDISDIRSMLMGDWARLIVFCLPQTKLANPAASAVAAGHP